MTPTMTPEAKRHLATTIRGLRVRLLDDLHDATDRAYQLSIRHQAARLSEAARRRREQLEAEMDVQVRAADEQADRDRMRAHALRDIEKEAAYTLLNRLVYLRCLEAAGLTRLEVITGGWESKGYRELRDDWGPGLTDDETQGYALLLQLVFEDLALELPGLFGDVGHTRLIPIPAATLRAVVEAMDDPALASCWTDDTTLGWVYQYWNDPEREAIDAKLHSGGKVAPDEIASKTQMFTERYMVEWLLQNSLGQMWLAMCDRHDWTAAAEVDGPDGRNTLERLEARRVAWRQKRAARETALTVERGKKAADAGHEFDESKLPGVALDALMPIDDPLEHRWKYWVPQPMPEDAVAQAPASVRDIKLLDPACGSGHFLVIAFDLLAAMYCEEAERRGEAWSDREIAEWILEDNLYGVEIDPRAAQIAAAALMLKAQTLCGDARPRRMNVVASNLRLGALSADDLARRALREAVKASTGIPGDLTDGIVDALADADHLGSLLRVDRAVEEAIAAHERNECVAAGPVQGDLQTGLFPPQQTRIDFTAARRSLVEALECFLAKHTGADDLGLRLRGEQLAAGVRFMRMVSEGQYDLIVGNPPYQGTSKMVDAAYVRAQYPRGKADLYAAFLERGLELARPGGVSALLTMRNWMFIKQYAALREWLLETYDLRALGDFDRGAFEDVPDEVVAVVVVSVFRKTAPGGEEAVALQATPLDDRTRDCGRTPRKRAATLCHVGRYGFHQDQLRVVPDRPLVYWWSLRELDLYRRHSLLGGLWPAKKGIDTGRNTRFVRKPWEAHTENALVRCPENRLSWAPYVMGGKGLVWFEPLQNLVRWRWSGTEIRIRAESSSGTTIRNPEVFFVRGVAFTPIGARFTARAHRFRSICDNMGTSVFPTDLERALCLLNSSTTAALLQALNPGVHFQAGDVGRIPFLPVAHSAEVCSTLDTAFSTHESRREPSVEFRRPGASPWKYAQAWAQEAVDLPEGALLPDYDPVYADEDRADHVSFAVGLALGRFDSDGAGLLETAPPTALPAGILYLDAATEQDSLAHPACAPLLTAWFDHGPDIAPKADLRTWLRRVFFPDVHRTMYENRPIYFPLSSAKRTFVAFVSIHRWTLDTLRTLLADHLHPARTRLEGQLDDLRRAKTTPDRKAAAERRFAQVQLQLQLAELEEFIEATRQCAEEGPPPPDAKTPPRKQDARCDPDLDDGVMINSAALWPLLSPQWKDPKKWWKELAQAKGRKDYDWSHLARRYFPARVEEKCKTDPSLGVAHGCFWKYHPARVYRWEQRLQHEIGPDFTIDEDGSDAARANFEAQHPADAATIRLEERKRAERKAERQTKLALTESGSQANEEGAP